MCPKPRWWKPGQEEELINLHAYVKEDHGTVRNHKWILHLLGWKRSSSLRPSCCRIWRTLWPTCRLSSTTISSTNNSNLPWTSTESTWVISLQLFPTPQMHCRLMTGWKLWKRCLISHNTLIGIKSFMHQVASLASLLIRGMPIVQHKHHHLGRILNKLHKLPHSYWSNEDQGVPFTQVGRNDSKRVQRQVHPIVQICSWGCRQREEAGVIPGGTYWATPISADVSFPSFQRLLNKAIALEHKRVELGEMKRKGRLPTKGMLVLVLVPVCPCYASSQGTPMLGSPRQPNSRSQSLTNQAFRWDQLALILQQTRHAWNVHKLVIMPTTTLTRTPTPLQLQWSRVNPRGIKTRPLSINRGQQNFSRGKVNHVEADAAPENPEDSEVVPGENEEN